MRRRSYYVVGTRSPSWIRWHRLSICLGHAIPNKTPFLPLNIYIRTYIYIKRSATKIDDKRCERKLIEKEVWTLYKMYKMKDYFCMWLQYYILFFWDSFWSKMINIFYERFLIYTLSLTLYPNSHYLCAKWNGNMKNQKKRCYHWSNFNFLFLYELYRKEKKPCSISPVPTVCCLCWLWAGRAESYEVFPKWYIRMWWDRFVIAPVVYSTCKMFIQYLVVTAVIPRCFFFSVNNVHEMIVLSSLHRISRFMVLCIM